MMLFASSILAEEQLRCDYGDGGIKIINSSESYQCPPTLKEVYRLIEQTNYSNNIYYAAGGGPTVSIDSSFDYVPIQEDSYLKRKAEYEKERQLKLQKIGRVIFVLPILTLFFVILIFMIDRLRRKT